MSRLRVQSLSTARAYMTSSECESRKTTCVRTHLYCKFPVNDLNGLRKLPFRSLQLDNPRLNACVGLLTGQSLPILIVS